jgi:transcriptional regulator with GAF, ATPase, and Fis domain
LRQNVEWIERETIRRALEMSTVKRQAARIMGISPRALAYYLAKYPFIDTDSAHGAKPSSVTSGLSNLRV